MVKLKTCGMVLMGLCCQLVFAQQSIDAYVTDPSQNEFILIASSTDSLFSPVDLDFYPDQSIRPELWILNQGTSHSGGSTVIIFNANKNTRTYKYIKDGNAMHFMALASAMAFGNKEWASSADILDANHRDGNFAGPTLWPSDLSIYGIVGNPSSSEVNGSHLSMIHQSPYSKGIAWEKDLVFWVLDGYEGVLVRYDFGIPHEPGGDDHSGGSARVYISDFTFTKHESLPSHVVIDANKKYLYGCDPVGKRIFRVDITTGSDNGPREMLNPEDNLASYRTFIGLSTKDIVTSGLTLPVGIDVYGERLVVTDTGSDEIIIYDISDNYREVGRIALEYTTSPDPMGIKVGPDGKIYFVDKTNKSAYMIDNSGVGPLAINSVEEPANKFSLFPNPVNSHLTLQTNIDLVNAEIKFINMLGETVLSQDITNTDNLTFDVTSLQDGVYFVQVSSGNKSFTQKFIKK